MIGDIYVQKANAAFRGRVYELLGARSNGFCHFLLLTEELRLTVLRVFKRKSAVCEILYQSKLITFHLHDRNSQPRSSKERCLGLYANYAKLSTYSKALCVFSRNSVFGIGINPDSCSI